MWKYCASLCPRILSEYCKCLSWKHRLLPAYVIKLCLSNYSSSVTLYTALWSQASNHFIVHGGTQLHLQ